MVFLSRLHKQTELTQENNTFIKACFTHFIIIWSTDFNQTAVLQQSPVSLTSNDFSELTHCLTECCDFKYKILTLQGRTILKSENVDIKNIWKSGSGHQGKHNLPIYKDDCAANECQCDSWVFYAGLTCEIQWDIKSYEKNCETATSHILWFTVTVWEGQTFDFFPSFCSFLLI